MSTHNIPFSIKKRKITLNYLKSAAVGFFQRTQKRVRNSRGRRAISVRATEVLLFYRYDTRHWLLYISENYFYWVLYTACSTLRSVALC